MSELMANGWLFAGGAAALTMLATGWGYVKAAYAQVASRVILRVTVAGYQADAVQLYLKNHFEASKWGPRSYLGWMLYVRRTQRVQLVPMETTPGGGKLYWRGWRPLWCVKEKSSSDETESGSNSREWTDDCLTLVLLRGTFNADELIVAASDWFNEQVVASSEAKGRRHFIRHIHGTAGKDGGLASMITESKRSRGPSSPTDIRSCQHYRPLTHGFEELGPDLAEKGTAFDRLALSANAVDLVEEARRWKESEHWYKERGIPWRRGWMLHGKPGTGKTAMVRALAEDLDLPVFVYDLASLHNNELVQAWAKMLSEVPCVALIEDIDAVFEGRRNVSAGDDKAALTFDCLLNCLDGIERADGLFTVITTNRLDTIDPALGRPDPEHGPSRPGRIDHVLELGVLDEAGRRKLASRILEEWPSEWQALIEEGAGDTPAQFQERATRRALKLHYAEVERKRLSRAREASVVA